MHSSNCFNDKERSLFAYYIRTRSEKNRHRLSDSLLNHSGFLTRCLMRVLPMERLERTIWELYTVGKNGDGVTLVPSFGLADPNLHAGPCRCRGLT